MKTISLTSWLIVLKKNSTVPTIFSRHFPSLKNCRPNFKTLSRIQDCTNPSITRTENWQHIKLFLETRCVPVSLWISSKNVASFPSVFRPSDSITSWLCTLADNKIFPSTSSLSKLFAIASHLNLSSAQALTLVIPQSKKTSDKHETDELNSGIQEKKTFENILTNLTHCCLGWAQQWTRL